MQEKKSMHIINAPISHSISSLKEIIYIKLPKKLFRFSITCNNGEDFVSLMLMPQITPRVLYLIHAYLTIL